MKFKLYGLAFTLIISSFSCTNNDDSANSSFTKISQNRIGGSSIEEPVSSTSTNDGGQIIIAWTKSIDGDVVPNHPPVNDPTGDINIWVVKLDSKCKIEWKKTYGGTNFEYGYKIIQTKDGGYLFSITNSSSDGDFLLINEYLPYTWTFTNSLLVKIDASGTIQWQKIINYSNDSAIDIIQTEDGGYLYNTFFSLNKIDPNGNLTWTKSLDFYCYNILQLPDNNIILSGCITPSEYFDTTGIIAKTDSNGNFVWKNTYTKTFPSKVILSVDGGLLAVGRSNNKNVPVYIDNKYSYNINETMAYAWFSKLNLSGNQEWEKGYAPNSEPGGIPINVISFKNEYIIGGFNNDYWILKMDNLGNFITQKTFGGSDYDQLKNITLGKNGNIFLSGITDSKDGDLKNTAKYGNLNTDIWILNIKIN